MLVRIRSKDGNFRFEILPTATAAELAQKILETTKDADPSTICISERPRGGETNINTLMNQSLEVLGLKHGDLIFVSYKPVSEASSSAPDPSTSVLTASNGAVHGTASAKRAWELVTEDSVDTFYRQHDGKIPRSRDTRFCKHGINAMCDYCMPLEPYDTEYHTKHNIKHLSFHAYLRKISPPSSASSSSVALPPLVPLSYRVKNPCPSGGHSPWPAGICTGCQPSAITLQPQPFRMVDHLEFADRDIIDRFLNAWRRTATQRFGWLIGRYEPYEEVPMGIKAVVEAIHEPSQEGEIDGLSLGLPWEDEARIRNLASGTSTPLKIVGQIFTDLTPDEEDKTKLIYKRHKSSYFLSSLETIWAAAQQLNNPTTSRSSPTGSFSSRLVTAVLSGTEEGGVDVQAYQVSEQACAMVDADMIEASVEAGIVRVKEEDREVGTARYVPDVFFRYKNEYGLEVKKSAKPCFPVEYLLVNVTHGFPKNPAPLFRSTAFPIENRPGLEDQDIQHVLQELNRIRAFEVVDSGHGMTPEAISSRMRLAHWLSDWHLISFLGTVDFFSPAELSVLVRTASAPDLEDPTVLDALLSTSGWQTLVTIARESAVPQRPSGSAPSMPLGGDDIPSEMFDQFMDGGAGPSSGKTVCPHCTFENEHSGGDCDVCGLPLG
ncbi:polyubiquitin-tagged protein recognition complex Npl4 component [Ramaria rubella]|nr:polyubiquitin-tagged protein recognition complex Npl4 component [Ramaria rubella]